MKKSFKKITFLVCFIMVIGSAFSAFATDVNTNNSKRTKGYGRQETNTDTIIGKITSIDATNLTIDVATRTKRTKNTSDGTANNQTDRQKPTEEDRYTLTGESKTFNIASADFGRKAVDGTTNVESTENAEKGEKLSCADYVVGDYIRITVNNEIPTVAKRIRKANQGFNSDRMKKAKGNYVGGYKGSYTGKTKAEKAAEKQ